jgi:tetrahydromethanopterin S-methyltransferase subunit B
VLKVEPLKQEPIDCPYCHAVLVTGALSCRYCSRDLTPVLPLLSRISKLESRFADLEASLTAQKPEARLLPPPASRPEAENVIPNRIRLWPLPAGFVALLAAYATVVLWLDLSLSVLQISSIVIPFTTGFLYLGTRYRLHWTNLLVAFLFSSISVFAMNFMLSLMDSIPLFPQDTAAWRETMYYMISIAASMLSGMLLRVSIMSLGARGLTSLPQLRQGLLTINKSIPLDTLKAIELAVLLVGTLMSAIAGLFAGILGLSG